MKEAGDEKNFAFSDQFFCTFLKIKAQQLPGEKDGKAYVPAEPKAKRSWKKVVFAWSPFYLLAIFIMIWSFPGFKALFEDSGMLFPAVLDFILPGTYSSTAGQGIVFNLNFIGATGTAILLAVLVTVVLSKNMSWARVQKE